MLLSVDDGHGAGAPSDWLRRHAALLRPGTTAIDVASGRGRHARWLAAQGLDVLAVDRDADALRSLDGVPGVRTQTADLEHGAWPLEGRTFDTVVVTNYLWRPRFDAVLALVAPGGWLLYETFAHGHEALGRPSRPDFLLAPGELLARTAGWHVVDYQHGRLEAPPRIVQRIVARRPPVGAAEAPPLPA